MFKLVAVNFKPKTKQIMIYLFTLIFLNCTQTAIAQSPHCSDYLIDHTTCSSNQFNKCDESIVNSYTKNLFIPLNAHLRKIELEPACNQVAKQLKATLKKLSSISEPTIMYRTMAGNQKFKKISVGECYADPGFVSLSRKANLGTNFTFMSSLNIKPSFLKVKTTTARDIARFSAAPSEEECILLPNTALLVTKITPSEKYDIVEMFEVNTDECSKVVRDLRERLE